MHSLRLVAVSKRLRLCNKLLFDTSAAPLFAYTCWLSLVAALLRFSFIAHQRRLTHCRPASSTDRFWSKNNMASPTSDGDSQNPTSLLLRSATKTNNTSPGSDTAYNFTTLHDSTMMASTTPNFTIIDPNVTSSNKCASCAGRATHRCQGCANGVDRYGNLSKSFYCGKECQRTHRDSIHKVDCKVSLDRRQLYRIGSLLH